MRPSRGPTVGAFAFALLVGPAAAEEGAACRSEAFEDTGYTVCSFDPAFDDMRIFWRKADGTPYGTFSALAEDLATQGLTLVFGMNGGMYQDDFSPVGLLVMNGIEAKGVNTTSVGPDVNPVPNFYKKPNGIFFIGTDGAATLTTESYIEDRPAAEFATQSGPMLVIDGNIHPAFIVGSTDLNQRNGVGVCKPNEVSFVISEDDVNFETFARFFRDKLGCANALFLDGGSAPGIFAPELGRDDPPGHGGYGPIIAVVRKAP